MLKNLNKTPDKDIISFLGLELPIHPVKEEYPTTDDIIDTLNIKQRNRYYWLDTQCSTIGKYIHPNGVFANERKELSNKKNHPNELNGSGRDAILYTYIPTISVKEIDDMFFSMQSEYREYQSELNSMKHDIQDKVNMEIFRIDSEYEHAVKAYNAKVEEINIAVNDYRYRKTVEIQSLKIAIPDNLKDLYKNLSK